MAPNPEPGARGNPLETLRQIERLRHERVAPAPLDPGVLLLRRWQALRLSRTYADLLEHPRYQSACRFFLDDLYGARDFSQRDHDLTQMYEFSRRVFPEQSIRPLARTVELHFMTQSLDARLLDALVNRLGVTDTITPALYAEAYRLCDNYVERVQQIELIGEIGQMLDGLVKLPLVGAAVALARGPAARAGYGELTEFLERGYNAFKHMRGSTFFLSTVRQRELRILDKLFANDPDPFGFSLE